MWYLKVPSLKFLLGFCFEKENVFKPDPSSVVKGKRYYTVKRCPYPQLGSWLHHEAVWPHTQLYLKQTHLRNYYTLR